MLGFRKTGWEDTSSDAICFEYIRKEKRTCDDRDVKLAVKSAYTTINTLNLRNEILVQTPKQRHVTTRAIETKHTQQMNFA